MRKINTYIWDLDGTLLDSYGCIVSSLADVAEEYHIPDSYPDIMKSVKQESVSAYLRELSEKSGVDTITLYRRYKEISYDRMDRITLISGAVEVLKTLRDAGADHFVYTHRGRSSELLLSKLGLTSFFTEIVTAESGFKPKPSGDGVLYLIEKYGLLKASAAYVGDRILDVYCAKDAGVQAILFLPEDSCVIPTGTEDKIITRLEELAG